MDSYQQPIRGQEGLSTLSVVLLIVVSFTVHTTVIQAQGTQQPIKPEKLTSSSNLKSPFPLIEEPEIKEFDALPKEARETRLASQGPLFPRNYNLSNFSTRVFLKGNAPLVIDYALEPNSTALVMISGERADLTIKLTESEAFRNEAVPQLIPMLPPSGTPEQRAIMIGLALVARFLLHPEKARRQVIVDLPAEFGEGPQAGKLSIQAFTSGPGESRPAYFRLYGLAMGSAAIGSTAGRAGTDGTRSNHSRAAFPAAGEGSTAIDQIILSPGTVNLNRREKVSYQIHSRSAFNNVRVIFYRVEVLANTSVSRQAHTEALGPITENGWLRPRQCQCAWDGKSGGAGSKGLHDLEVQAWLGLGVGEWASAWSDPKTVRIK